MKEPPAYRPDPEHAIVAAQVAFLFHVLVGPDPIGDFQAVENVSYEVTPFRYPEGGRNHSARLFPFDGPGAAGEVTLRWGMLVRSALYDWMRAVRVGHGFRRTVTILQLNRQKIPLRLMRLRHAWPTSWQGANLSSVETGFAVEQLTLVYEDIQLVSNLGLVSVPPRVRGQDVSELESSDYQAEQERLDALLEEVEAERKAQRAREAELVEARRTAEQALIEERLRAEETRTEARELAESEAEAFRARWESTRGDTASADGEE